MFLPMGWSTISIKLSGQMDWRCWPADLRILFRAKRSVNRTPELVEQSGRDDLVQQRRAEQAADHHDRQGVEDFLARLAYAERKREV